MEDLIKRSKAIDAIHNYWKKRLETLPTTMSEYGEVYANTREMDKMLEHNRTLCNFINAIPSADRPQGEWVNARDGYDGHMKCNQCFRTYDWDSEAQYYNYCPNCGARMKGADDD